jgi:putative FmdB family regulatory protein
MPTYDFKCRKCSLVFEKLVNSAITLIPCDACSSAPADRLLSCPASIKMADMATVNRKRDRIREPILRDKETGKVTSFY